MARVRWVFFFNSNARNERQSLFTRPIENVEQDNDNNEASELSMKNVGGVFIVLVSGVGIAAVLATLEMFWTLWKTSTKEKVRKI